MLALERDGAGAALRRYVYGEHRISMTTGANVSYYHHDKLGSVANVTSASGTGQWTYDYEPFGATRLETEDVPASPQNVLKFAGELLDPTGLYYLRARLYDPVAGASRVAIRRHLIRVSRTSQAMPMQRIVRPR